MERAAKLCGKGVQLIPSGISATAILGDGPAMTSCYWDVGNSSFGAEGWSSGQLFEGLLSGNVLSTFLFDHSVPKTHGFDVFFSREDHFVGRISWISAENDRMNFKNLFASGVTEPVPIFPAGFGHKSSLKISPTPPGTLGSPSLAVE